MGKKYKKTHTKQYETLRRLTKEQILRLAQTVNEHGHTMLEHPNKAMEVLGLTERVGFFDIETTDLKADYGYMLTYCILADDGELITNKIKPKEQRDGTFDFRLVNDCLNDLRKFDRLVTYYGCFFDLPFVRTRAVKHGLEFLPFKAAWHTDLWQIIKRKFRLRNNRMQTACDLFGIESKDHRITPEHWMQAGAGNKDSIQYILQHNIEDVQSTKELYERVKMYANITKTSI